MRLLNTAKAGEILGCSYNRVAALISQGHLKDYNERKPGEKKHYHRVSEVEVRELKKNFKLAYRGLEPRNSNNGRASDHVRVKVTEPSYEEQIQSPIRSISQRLEGIESRLNELNEQMHQLIKVWS